MMRYQVRRVWGVDGEGKDIDGRHRYVYLCAYQRHTAQVYDLRDHTAGLDTERCLLFLTDLPHLRTDILAGYFFGYDVAMLLGDVAPPQLTVLHRAGFVVWRAPRSGILFYLEYHPGKSFFVGRLERPLARGERPHLVTWRWRGHHWCHIEDVGSYSQQSFVKTLADWQIVDEATLGEIAAMKAKRGQFDQESPAAIERYCQMECAQLACYVSTLQDAVLGEGLTPSGWHGPGAIGTALLKRERVKERLSDGPDDLAHAVRCAYFGGRTENAVVGLLPRVYNCDLQSAYPASLSGRLGDLVGLPDLGHGHWEHTMRYDPSTPWALWHVRWALPGVRALVMPFPVRTDRAISYPMRGEGWYHASLVATASSYCPPGTLTVLEGYCYQPEDATQRPFDFIQALAEQRVAYKAAGDSRHRTLKLALNSLYGKLAQHSLHEGKPPYQCYYAAGYVTAATQAELLRQVYSDGHDGSDVVGFATDGLFTLEPRTRRVGAGLGEWEQNTPLEDVLIIQPGVYYARNGRTKSRGFHRESLNYDTVSAIWRDNGTLGRVTYGERRFVGIGACAGHGIYEQYGQWIESQREVLFYPSKPVGEKTRIGDAYWLNAPSGGTISEEYVPGPPLDLRAGWDDVAATLELWWERDQPG